MSRQSVTSTQHKTSASVPTASGVFVLHRKCAACGNHTMGSGGCSECLKGRKRLQRLATEHGEVSDVPSIVYDVLSAPGQPLDLSTRVFFEQRFGRNFSRVRVHTDSDAAASAQAVNSLAYTVGSAVVFGREQYRPQTDPGRKLLAHELAHVIQQGDAVANPPTSIRLGAFADPAELEAEKASANINASVNVPVPTAASTVLQRQPANAASNTDTRPWSASKDISAGIIDSKGCYSAATPAGVFNTGLQGINEPYSTACNARTCTKEPLSLEFLLHMDGDVIPRPPPFENSRAALSLTFLPEAGGAQVVFGGISEATYINIPGAPLRTSFGTKVPFIPQEPGTLVVSLTHADRTSGEVATYSDMIPIVSCPKEAKEQRQNAVQTGIHVVIPDPNNAPYTYHRLTRQDGLDQPGLIVEVERDSSGYFYKIAGLRYPMADRP